MPVPAGTPATAHDLPKTTRSGIARHQTDTAKLVKLSRLTKVAELYIRSNTHEQIAAILQCSPTTVKNDLREIRRIWKDTITRDFDERVELELQKLDLIEREAWAAWERSKQPAETTTATKAKDGSVKSWTLQEESQCGDPAYLTAINRAIERRCKLLGLDAPVKSQSEVSGQLSVNASVTSTVLIHRENMKQAVKDACQRRNIHLPSLEREFSSN